MWLKHPVYLKNEYIYCPRCKKQYTRDSAAPGKGHKIRANYVLNWASVAYKPIARRPYKRKIR